MGRFIGKKTNKFCRNKGKNFLWDAFEWNGLRNQGKKEKKGILKSPPIVRKEEREKAVT